MTYFISKFSLFLVHPVVDFTLIHLYFNYCLTSVENIGQINRKGSVYFVETARRDVIVVLSRTVPDSRAEHARYVRNLSEQSARGKYVIGNSENEGNASAAVG